MLGSIVREIEARHRNAGGGMLGSIVREIEAKHRNAKRVTVTCYGQRKEFEDTRKAINFFTLAVNGCDPQSSECGRYQRILNRIYAGERIVSDE